MPLARQASFTPATPVRLMPPRAVLGEPEVGEGHGAVEPTIDISPTGVAPAGGCRTALTNLIAASSAAGTDFSAAEALLLKYSQEPAESLRTQSFRCNVAARRARQVGDNETALKLSDKAIAIALELGDKRVQLLNRINRANALRGLGRLDEALEAYKAVSAEACTASMMLIEAHATRLAARVLNRQLKYGEALHHARYAIGLLRESEDSGNLMLATREEAGALEGLREWDSASRAYFAAGRLARANDEWGEVAACMSAAIGCLNSGGQWQSLPGQVLELFGEPTPASFMNALIDLTGRLPHLLAPLPRGQRGVLAKKFFELLFDKQPAFGRGQAVEALVQKLLETKTGEGARYVLVLMSVIPAPGLRLWEWVRLAELVAETSEGLAFKPHGDGAAQWTLSFGGADGVVGSIMQVDDAAETFFSCLCLAWLLSECGDEMIKSLGVLALPRDEFQLSVALTREWLDVIPNCGVSLQSAVESSRATDEASAEPPPIMAFIGDTFSIHEGHLMLLGGRVLCEVARHLLRGQVNDTALRRWLVPMVRGFMF